MTDGLKPRVLVRVMYVNSNDRAIVGLVMIAHAMVHTYELSIPILVTIWLAEFGTTEAVIGLVVTVGYGLFGLGALPGGVLTDAFGSRRLIVACLLGMGGSFLALSLAPNVIAITLALLVWGIAASVYHPSGLSLISKGVEERGSAFAYHGMAGNVGIALGPLTTAILVEFFDWRFVVAALAIPAAIAAVYAVRIDVDETAAVTATDGGPSRESSVSSFSEFLSDSKTLFAGAFAAVFAVAMLSGLYYRGVLTFLPEILGEFPTFEPIAIGERELEPARYFYAGLLMVGVLGQYVGGKLTDRMRTEKGLAVGFGALAFVAIVFLPATAAGLATFLVVGALLGFFLFLVQPMYQATIAEYSPPSVRGVSYGYTYLGVFGVGALGGALAGVILTYATARELFVVLAGFATLASLIGIALSRREKPRFAG